MGLMLQYKKFPDKYFDWKTDEEFPRNEINKHPLWYRAEYDKDGRLIAKHYYDNTWQRWEYTNGLLTYYERSDDYWSKHEYDESGNKTRMKDSDGFKVEWDYENCEEKTGNLK